MRKHFILDELHNDRLKEVRGYDGDQLVERYEVVYEKNDKVVGIRPLSIKPLIERSIWEKIFLKKPKPLSQILSVDFIGLIQYIGLINKINTISKIEAIDLISEITNIKKVGFIQPSVSVSNRGQLTNPDFEDFYYEAGRTPTEYVFQGWHDPLGVAKLYTPNRASGRSAITLRKLSTYEQGIFQQLSPPIPVDDIDFLTYMAQNNDPVNDIEIKMRFWYTDGINSTDTNAISGGGGWNMETVTALTSGKFLESMRIWTNDSFATEWDLLCLDALALKYKEEVYQTVRKGSQRGFRFDSLGNWVTNPIVVPAGTTTNVTFSPTIPSYLEFLYLTAWASHTPAVAPYVTTVTDGTHACIQRNLSAGIGTRVYSLDLSSSRFSAQNYGTFNNQISLYLPANAVNNTTWDFEGQYAIYKFS